MESYTIKKEIKIFASPSVVFDNLTSSEEIIKYFPLKEVISSWKEGSEILYKGEINNQAFTDYGIIDVLSRARARNLRADQTRRRDLRRFGA